jgi:TPR repeat
MLQRLAVLALSVLSVLITRPAAHAAEACKFVKLVDLPVTVEGLRPLVSTKINGKDAMFLVDSGAFYSMLAADAPPNFGLKTSAAPFGFYIRGVGEAIREYDAALRLQPKSPWGLYGRGLAKLKKGQGAEGRADIAAAMAVQPAIEREMKSYGLGPDIAAAVAIAPALPAEFKRLGLAPDPDGKAAGA